MDVQGGVLVKHDASLFPPEMPETSELNASPIHTNACRRVLLETIAVEHIYPLQKMSGIAEGIVYVPRIVLHCLPYMRKAI